MKILITRHGESLYNIERRIGGDPSLSESGKEYAKHLADFLQTLDDIPSIVYASTKKRVIQTLAHCKNYFSKCTYCPDLDEINAGICENLTYEEVKIIYPNEFKARLDDKLNYCYPKGESYRDIFERVKSFITNIVANGNNIFIVCHQAITRALLYHLTSIPIRNIPTLKVPLHHVLSLTGNPGEMSIELLKI